MKTPTLRDIAADSGVSVTTASLVLSGKGRISDSVRNAVLDAANRMGYGKKRFVPLGGKKPALGILLSIDPHWAFVWHFIRPIIAEIERIFTAQGYTVLLVPIYEDLPKEALLSRIVEQSCVGVVSLDRKSVV